MSDRDTGPSSSVRKSKDASQASLRAPRQRGEIGRRTGTGLDRQGARN